MHKQEYYLFNGHLTKISRAWDMQKSNFIASHLYPIAQYTYRQMFLPGNPPFFHLHRIRISQPATLRKLILIVSLAIDWYQRPHTGVAFTYSFAQLSFRYFPQKPVMEFESFERFNFFKGLLPTNNAARYDLFSQ